jgi:hypothetical protein
VTGAAFCVYDVGHQIHKEEGAMRFARRVLIIAGIYGLAVVIPSYFLETRIGRDFPPPIAHPEYYYGFLGVTLAWQVLFLFMARDPVRYRLLLIPAVLEKVSFGVAAIALLAQHRIPLPAFGFAMVDWIFAALFIASFAMLSAGEQ